MKTNSLTAYFAIPPELINTAGTKAILRQDSWAEPLPKPDPLPDDYEPEDREGKERIMKVISWRECPLADDRILVKVEWPRYFVKRLEGYCLKRGVDNPHSQAGLVCLDIAGSFLGKTPEAVKNKCPELAGTKTVQDGEGNDVEIDIMSQKNWSFE